MPPSAAPICAVGLTPLMPASLLLPRPAPGGVANVEDDDLVSFHGVEPRVPESANVDAPDTRHLGLFCCVGVIEQPRDCGVNEAGKSRRAGGIALDQVGNGVIKFDKSRVGIPRPHAPALRARLNTAATA